MDRQEAIKRAGQYEEKGDNLKAERKKDSSLYENMIKAYEDAGDEYKDAWMPNKAKGNYEMALKYAYDDDKKRITKKLQNMGVKESKISSPRRGFSMGRGLEKKFVFAFLSIILLVSALFFVSFSLTGNIILGLTKNNSRWVGLCLFICGLIFTFLYFRKK